MTWEKGRQLKSFDGNTYTYNANGIRTSKTVNGVKHDYVLDGTKILRETWGENVLIPLYDNEDSVCGICFNGEYFYFQKNLQGDIISVTDKDANEVAKYTYDAWGVCTIVSDTSACSIATINPFRYRGYFYDNENQLYYLQSRYYNPEAGRFINADDVSMLGASDFLSQYSLFAYCDNNPANSFDINGKLSWSVFTKGIAYIFDFFVKVAETAGSASKEMESVINQIKRAKQRGASKAWIKTLKKKKNNLMKASNLGVGGIKVVATMFSIISTILPYLPYLKRIKDGVVALAEIVVDIAIEVLGAIAGVIVSLVCKWIPFAGFLIGWALGFVVDRIMEMIFCGQRISRIKGDYAKRVKNTSNWKKWIQYLAPSFASAF